MEKEHFYQPVRRIRCAFTLIELIMVVAIIAVVSAIAVPRISGNTSRYQLDAAARRLAGDIESAQQQAIASSSSRTVTFDFTGKYYTLSKLAEDGSVIITAKVPLSEAPYQITKLHAAVAGNAATPIIFDGFGKPNGSGTIELKMNNKQKFITLNGVTGKATVN